MIYDRYYYLRLTPAEKEQYKAIYRGLSVFEKAITLKSPAVDFSRVLTAINLDNPHLFYVDFSRFQWTNGLFETTLIPTYLMKRAEATKIKKQLEPVLQQIAGRVLGTTDLEKELALHDLLATMIRYDYSALKKPDSSEKSHTVVGPLLYQAGVCDGIAKTVKWLLNLLNIKCIVVNGDSDMPQASNLTSEIGHAWNIVKIGSFAYHLDMTWDINLSDKHHIRHDYFNLSDAAIKQDHRWNERLPACSISGQDYYSLYHLLVQRRSDLRRVLLSCLRAHKRTVSFRVVGGVWPDLKALVKDAMTILTLERRGPIGIKYSENRFQSIVWLKW